MRHRSSHRLCSFGRSTVAAAIAIALSAPASAQSCDWMLMTDSGPSERVLHRMAYDRDREVAVLFGGQDGAFRYVDDTWQWDGAAWSRITDTGPSARREHAMAYDDRRGATVLFGGVGLGGFRDDTWEFDGAEWTQITTLGPSERRGHAMAYDRRRGVTVLFGGGDRNAQYMDDTWEWDGVEWRRIPVSGPSPRYHHAMAYYHERGVIVLFGGWDWSYLADTWEWDGMEWRQVADTGPDGRFGHALAYDHRRGVIVLYGGMDGTHLAETWEWDGIAWRFVTDAGPAGHGGSAMVYDEARDAMILFGGGVGEQWPLTPRRETWRFMCRAIRLAVEATCPNGGPARVEWSGATADGSAALLFATSQGAVIVGPGRPCAGTQLDLGTHRLQIAWRGRSGPDGSRTLNTTAPGAACGGYLQLLDISKCATSNVARVE